MDVFFTLAVWVILVSLIAHGLRLARLARDGVEAAQSAFAGAPSSDPVPASAAGERGRSPVLVGAGTGQPD